MDEGSTHTDRPLDRTTCRARPAILPFAQSSDPPPGPPPSTSPTACLAEADRPSERASVRPSARPPLRARAR